MRKAIVYVDSDGGSIERINFLIKVLGEDYVVETAQKPSEALKVLNSLHEMGIETSVVISNFILPEMNGIKLCSKIHTQYPYTQYILIALNQSLDFYNPFIKKLEIHKIFKGQFSLQDLTQVVKEASQQYEQRIEIGNLHKQLLDLKKGNNLVLESITEQMAFIDIKYNVLWVNSKAKKEINDVERQKKCYQIFYKRQRPCSDCIMKQMVSETGDCNSSTFEKKLMNQKYRLIRYYPVFSSRKSILGVVVSMHDITVKRKVEKMNHVLINIAKYVSHAESIKEMYKQVFNIASNVLMEDFYVFIKSKESYDTEFYGKDQNSIKKSLVTVDHLLEKSNNQFVSQEIVEVTEYNETVQVLIVSGVRVFVFFLHKNDDVPMKKRLQFIQVIVEQMVGSIQRIENLNQISFQANHDTLTGLYNREFFVKSLENVLNSSTTSEDSNKKYTLAVIDLNYFKEVNDTYGHLKGDELLLQVSIRIQEVLSKGDLVARIGGDEFGVLLAPITKDEASEVIKKIQQSIAHPMYVSRHGIQIGSSVGLVFDVKRYSDYIDALKHADYAMYQAKKDKKGYGQFKFYEKEIEYKLRKENQMIQQLEKGIKNNEFLFYYQPIISIAEMKLVGFEALLRWNSNVNNVFSPEHFISVAEENGYIHELSELLIKDILKARDLIHEEYFISINLTRKQLFTSSQMKIWEELFAKNNNLCIEIKEQALHKDFAQASMHLKKLKDYDIKVYLDDFGVGYSSMSFLNVINIDLIKMDAQLINSLFENNFSMNLAHAILTIAKSLGVKVLAEGVESQEQLEYLKKHDCDFVQGYLVSKPLSIVEVKQFLNQWDLRKCEEFS